MAESKHVVRESGWRVTVHGHGEPVFAPTTLDREARIASLVELWQEHIGAFHDFEGDQELFIEQALRLETAIDSFGADNLYLVIDEASGVATHLGTGATVSFADIDHLPRYGGQARQSAHHPKLAQELEADSYMRFRTFQEHAGREVILASVGSDDNPDLYDTITAVANRHDGQVFVKVNRAKYGIQKFQFPAGVDRATVWHDVCTSDIGLAGVHLEGLADAFGVQNAIPMRYEYRLFVVDQRAVTGAGCVEEYTPLDNRGLPFDERLREHRGPVNIHNDVEPVRQKSHVTAALVRFGRAVIAELAAERPNLRDYVLDVAVGPDNELLIVELNGLLNAGLYASQPDRITHALAAARASATTERPDHG